MEQYELKKDVHVDTSKLGWELGRAGKGKGRITRNDYKSNHICVV